MRRQPCRAVRPHRRRPSDAGGRVQVNAFYTYDGSLTTPGCTQDVRWFLAADHGNVSAAAVRRFHQLIARFPGYNGYPNNNRPSQPLNGRIVRLRRAEHLLQPAEGRRPRSAA